MYMYDEEEYGDDSRLVKDLRKQLREATRERDELQSELSKVRTEAKKASVADLLDSRGAPKKLAKFALADGVEDAAGVDEWLAENGDIFGFSPKEEAPAVPAEDLAAMQRVQEVTSTALPPGDPWAQLEARSTQVQSVEELEQVWAEMQALGKGQAP